MSFAKFSLGDEFPESDHRDHATSRLPKREVPATAEPQASVQSEQHVQWLPDVREEAFLCGLPRAPLANLHTNERLLTTERLAERPRHSRRSPCEHMQQTGNIVE